MADQLSGALPASALPVLGSDLAFVSRDGIVFRRVLVSDLVSGSLIADGSVTNAKLADMATQTLKGRATAGTGDPEDLTASTVRTLLSLVPGSDVQAYDATLAALAGLTIAANSLTIGTGADAFSQTPFAANTMPARASTGNLEAKAISDFGLSLVDDADAATARSTLGLVIGTDVAAIASPAFTGNPTVPTAAPGTNTTQASSTAFVQAAVSLAVSGLLDLKGNLDCSANPNYPAGSVGDTYYVTVAGRIGGASGTVVEIGDAIICKTDNAGGDQATVGSSWFILEHNLQGALLTANALSELTGVASTARTNLGFTTVGSAFATLANPGAVTFPRIDAANTVTARSAANFATDLGLGTADSVTHANLYASATVRVNYASAITVGTLVNPGFALHGTTIDSCSIVNGRWSADASAPQNVFTKSRSAAVGTVGTAVINGDGIGSMAFYADDTATLGLVGQIRMVALETFSATARGAELRFNLNAVTTVSQTTALALTGLNATFLTNLKLGTAGNGIYIKEGTNATMGTGTLVAGVATVNTTKTTANSRIMVCRTTAGGTLGDLGEDSTARVAGTSFSVKSMTLGAIGTVNVLDTSTFMWLIFEPSP